MKQGIFLGLMTLLLLLCRPGRAETLLFLGDLHLTAQDGALSEVLDAVCRAAREADALILLGDSANNGRPEEHRRVTAFLTRVRQETGRPVYVLPGNHDLSGRIGQADFSALYEDFGYAQAAYRHDSSLSYAVQTAGNTWLVMLDLNRYEGSGGQGQADAYGWVSDSLLAWLEDVFSKIGGGRNAVVCAHYPIQPVLTETVADGEKLFALLERQDVRLYLCGHRHLHETWQGGGVRQITVGMPQSDPCCLGRLQKGENGWSYTLQPLFDEGDAFFETRREETRQLGLRMALGSLRGTPYEDGQEVAEWFAQVFCLYMEGRLSEHRDRLLADESCEKWRQAGVRQAPGPWIISILENTGESVWKLTGTE